jgi:hypothetical protein
VPIDDVFRAEPATEDEREVVAFPLVPQASQRASERRRKLFAEALHAAESAAKRVNGSGKSQSTDEASASAGSTPATLQATSVRGCDHQLPPSVDSTPTTPTAACREAEVSSPVIDMLRRLDIYSGQIVHVERLPARDASYRGMDELGTLDERVIRAVSAGGVTQLYSHQFEAIQAVQSGKNVVLSTSTASGKSLAYNVPMANMLLEDLGATFMYLFPTKVPLSVLSQADMLSSILTGSHRCLCARRWRRTSSRHCASSWEQQTCRSSCAPPSYEVP